MQKFGKTGFYIDDLPGFLENLDDPFLAMKAGDQRVVIEQLLGITLLSEKAEALSKQLKATKDAILQENANIEATKKANEKIQQSIDTLVLSQRAWNSKHTTDLEKIAKAIVKLFMLAKFFYN